MRIKGFIMFPCLTTGDVNHDLLAKVVSVRFLHFEVIMFQVNTLEGIFRLHMQIYYFSSNFFHLVTLAPKHVFTKLFFLVSFVFP